MEIASKIVGSVCGLLTILLWAVTLLTDPTPGAIGTAASFTALVAVTAVMSLGYWL